MFIPIGDMPNPRGTPVINYILIGVNVAVYLLLTLPMSLKHPDLNDPALLEYLSLMTTHQNLHISHILSQITAYDLFVFAHGFKPAHPSLPDLFSSIFLHAGLLHLAGNMLFLWIYGDNVEHRLGSFNYLLVYLTTGVAATLFYTLFQFNSTIPMIGASGAISGVLGLYFICFPRNKVRVFLVLFPFFMDVILLPARLVLGFYLIVNNLLPFLFASASGGGVAHGAHIGGFLAGLAIAFGIDRLPYSSTLSRWRPDVRTSPSVSSSDPGNKDLPLSQRVRDALEGEDYTQAVSDYFTAPSAGVRKTVKSLDRLQIGFYLIKQGRYKEALSVFRHYIKDHANGPYLDRAYLGAGVTLYQGMGQLTAAYQYFLAVLDVDPDPETENQARRYLQSIQELQKLPFGKKRG